MQATLGLWNAYNPVPMAALVQDTTNGWGNRMFAKLAWLCVALGLLVAGPQSAASTYVGCGASSPTTVYYTWYQPPGVKSVCGRSFLFTYSCTVPGAGGGFGQPVNGVPTITFQADPYISANGWQMKPFEAQEIVLLGVSWAFVTPGSTPLTYLTFGNNSRPDLMGKWDRTSADKDFWFPAGYGVPWPRATDATSEDYLDVHGACQSETGGGVILLTLYYQPQGEQPAPLPAPPSAWFKQLDLGDTAGTITHLQVIKNTDITGSGSQIRVTVRAAGGPGMVLTSFAICPRLGQTDSCAAPFTELKFGGTAGISLPGGADAVTDWTSVAFSNATDYLVKMAHGSVSNVKYAASGVGAYYRVGSSGDFTFAPNLTFGVSRIEAK